MLCFGDGYWKITSSFLSRIQQFGIYLFFGICILSFSIAQAIEVSGHLTEDTTWSPLNNPYLVTGVVCIESDVTLTILPGTIIKFNDALLNYINNDEFWYINGEEPLVKYIKCYGNIIAEGTEQDSIIFTRMHDIANYHWGTIYLTPSSDLSVFKYCHFEYSAFIGISMYEQPEGALLVDNGFLKAENCSFIDNIVAVKIEGYSFDILIKDCDFKLIGPLLNNQNYKSIWGLDWDGFEDDNMLIAHNTSNTKLIMTGIPAYVVFNHVDYEIGSNTAISINSYDRRNYIFGNLIMDSCRGIFSSDNDTLYIKNNRFILNGNDATNIDAAYVEISENFISDGDIFVEYASGKIFNNTTENSEIWPYGPLQVSNNICYNNDGYGLKVGYNPYCTNNLSINNQYAIWGKTVTYDNCIIICNEELTQNYVSGVPVFRNCIIDFPLDPPLINGGGNIIVDSLQAQEIFVDIQNGDFHLAASSIAIDAGFDTIGYYYPFDLDYNHRVWDGDSNGSAIIDIGPYEYGAPAFGGIEGITYDPTTGDFVDYVLIKINDQAGEFTFSDSIGCFEIQLPAGIYDVYAERVFYDDAVIYQVEVFDGEFTQVDIPMYEIVEIQEHEIPNSSNQISNLTNYPNPFNPTTTISFNVTQSSAFATIEIYNLRGQNVKTFLINPSTDQPINSVTWNGTDNNNKPVSSGIYFARIKSKEIEITKKMMLIK